MPKKLGVMEQRELFVVGCKTIIEARDRWCGDSVLGIDPARGATGISYLESDYMDIRSINCGDRWGFSKVILIEKQLRDLLKETAPFVGLEGYAHNAKWGREKAGELGGVLRRLLYYKQRPLVIISPLTVKAWVKAGKKQHIMLEILDRYDIKIADEDAADAFIISDIVRCMILMADHICKMRVQIPNNIRLYFKDHKYKKKKGLEKLFAYQALSLFNLIHRQGPYCVFFKKTNPL